MEVDGIKANGIDIKIGVARAIDSADHVVKLSRRSSIALKIPADHYSQQFSCSHRLPSLFITAAHLLSKWRCTAQAK